MSKSNSPVVSPVDESKTCVKPGSPIEEVASDVLILNDGQLDYVNELLKKVL